MALVFLQRFGRGAARLVTKLQLYASPPCFLMLINETNPEHFRQHPIWSRVDPAHTDCPVSAESYLGMQRSNVTESVFLIRVIFLWMLSSLACVAIRCVRSSKGKGEWLNYLVLFLATERIAVETQAFIHFLNDATQMNHTIMHHVPQWDGLGSADLDHDGDHTFAPPMAHGATLTTLLSQIAASIAMGIIIDSSDFRRYENKGYWILCGGFICVFNIIYMLLHKRLHGMTERQIMESAWYYDRTFYQCHVQGHHFDGSCIKSSMDVHDFALFGLGHLLRDDWLVYDSFLWHIACVVVELFLFAQLLVKGYLWLRLAHWVQDYAVGDDRRYQQTAKVHTL